ncbi:MULTISPECIES: Y-family DNA polymerase [Prochlorococcus]|uniref:Nucleotidyltransferase/DNA polymerase n=1 Tax=Prochlorococcus marinus (strain SARG / CCMP1375 / SS120) TaxID=167539 RepID=Q7VCI1_PROMA|nr:MULTISPECIES: Y-family DNA polymerase [Prochlorococcus]AAP99803.1 Nucleotidyltransferase/DNA polymerase [Prochlorococcus marinus subsp. marinus str. CCMP1375]KGG11851.1 Error-prone [Prochlorococcus marinus str. LG]KGG21842.1 Error-prone [Prochlorococcus marinus str. SS2]KGG23727.1 Error-prone [Prochlorococcus marinus str. SS35]KGG32037.1 Error-prone [Prochlorococcus marinus str. SS51]
MSIALIDSNNFYASCEESMDPSIRNHPLIVLSNNDGCVIARNAEAKALGIAMGQPYFKVRRKLKDLGVKIRSSNYALYADMSRRLMSLIEANCEELEIYSIDEAFVKINRPHDYDLNPWAYRLRTTIYQSLSLPIAIGIGTTKSQSKLANHLAKTTASHAGIFDFEASDDQDHWLKQVAIENVWGIGRKLAYWCRMHGINNARQLRDTPSNELRQKFGVTGIRLQHELRGEKCLNLLIKSIPKKETCVSRSFSRPVSNIEELRQAIANHAVRASEKLRKQHQHATAVTVFTRTSLYTSPFYSQSATQRLSLPSNNTRVILSTTLSLTEKIFCSNCLLIKAGVIMQGLVNEDYLQLSLFSLTNPKEISRHKSLMKSIDYLNTRYGKDTIQWAVCGINQQEWEMCRRNLSPSATTLFKEIPIVKA